MQIKKCGWLLVIFLLCGCSAEETDSRQAALNFRTSLLGSSGCSYTANITADYGECVYEFAVDCRSEGDRVHVTVTEPEAIAGISAVVSENGTRISYEGAELGLGSLANGFVAPAAAPWLLEQCWSGAYIAWCGRDRDTDRVTYLRGYDAEELTVDTWFSDGVPIYAEIVYDGRKCLSVKLVDFKLI